MDESQNLGVVDRNCRVHGLGNLYLAGSAVFPTSGQANPTFFAVAIAARLAEHVRRSLAGRSSISA
jgi:choline dehydrogenase-like flavoprotein